MIRNVKSPLFEVLQKALRGLANANVPVIMFSCYQKGGTEHENIDGGSEWSIGGTCRLDFAFD
jgi:hypothetical protein